MNTLNILRVMEIKIIKQRKYIDVLNKTTLLYIRKRKFNISLKKIVVNNCYNREPKKFQFLPLP